MILSQSVHSIRLAPPAVLWATCKKLNGAETSTSINLNHALGNNNGKFDASDKRFAKTAENIHLKGFVLHADLKDPSSRYFHDTVDLDDFLTNENGRLVSHPDRLSIPRFCETCRGFPRNGALEGKLLSTNGEVFSASIGQINAQTRLSDCRVCQLLGQIATRLSQQDPRYCEPDTICSGGLPGGGLPYINFKFKVADRGGGKANYRTLSLYTKDDLPVASKPFDSIPTANHITNAFSGESISQVQDWMRKCDREHSACLAGDKIRTMPTRILDVGNEGSKTVCLVVSNGRKGRYVCLSYCWGNAVGENLRRGNIQDFKNGIPIASLPKTYRDAIRVCRGLSIRYLWIDALCIMQKDDKDWSAEFPKMAEYYGQSSLCIAATSSSNLDTGCNADMAPMEFAGYGEDKKPYHVFLRPEKFPHIAFGTVEKDMDSSFPILSRAWCYQERRLAPRVLHFTGKELFFECAGMSECQCGQPGTRNPYSWTKNRESFYVNQLDVSTNGDEKAKAEYLWYAHVRDYSGLSLTNLSDRLPGISGLARQVQQERDQLGVPCGRYLAGIWEDQLFDGLSWCVGKDLSRILGKSGKNDKQALINIESGDRDPKWVRPDSYIAPSWSWASVRDRVYYNVPFAEPLCTVISAETTLAGDALLGPVKDGFLLLRGKLRKVHSKWLLGIRALDRPYWGLLDLPGKSHRKCMKWYPDYDIKTWRDKDLELYLIPLTSRTRGQRHRYAATLLRMGELTIYLVLTSRDAESYERIGWAYTKGKRIDMSSEKEMDIKIV